MESEELQLEILEEGRIDEDEIFACCTTSTITRQR
jgi:hypothetical protein